MADKPYNAGSPVSASQLNKTHAAATRPVAMANAVHTPHGEFQSAKRFTLRRFELKDDLTADNTPTAAHTLLYDVTSYTYSIDTNTEGDFWLYSFSGFRGTGRVVDGEDVTNGTRGWCIYKEGRWEVIGGAGTYTEYDSTDSDESDASQGSEGSDASQGSEASQGSGGNGDGDESGSDKDTAIVPATWTPGKYTALFVMESPEVLFDDVLQVTIPQADTKIEMDPHYVEVCHPGSIRVCGHSTPVPILIGLEADDRIIWVRFAEQRPGHKITLVIRLTGARRGFAGHRFPNRTRQQFIDNERFINSAYKREP